MSSLYARHNVKASRRNVIPQCIWLFAASQPNEPMSDLGHLPFSVVYLQYRALGLECDICIDKTDSKGLSES